MDRPRKRGQRGPARKKRLQIDLGAQPTVPAIGTRENPSGSPAHVSTDDPTNKDMVPSTSIFSPTDTEEASTSRPKSASPEPNCAICLGKLENKSFTDSCFHMFCFVCLEEWSKVKAECPLCKQTFKNIIHNVRSLDDYDQYTVQPPGIGPFDIEAHIGHGQRFRYRTTVTDHRYAFAHLWERERQSRLLQRPSRYVPIPNWRRMRQPANSEFRRSIYDQRLRIKQDHQVNTRRRVRETSPTFFRENPAQTHRLVPWLNRELNALLEGHGSQVAFVLELIMGLIKRFPIGSDEVYEHLYPFIGRRTRQFMEEFLYFAKSPHMMAAYDRHVTYEPQETAPNHDSESDSETNVIRNNDDDGNDSDVIVVSPTSEPVRGGSPAFDPGAPSHRALDPWERSILTDHNPSYLGFPPISRSRGHNDLSEFQFDQDPYRSFHASTSTSASGWDSPTPNTSQLMGCGLTSGIDMRSLRGGTINHSMLNDLLCNFDIPADHHPSASAPPSMTNTEMDPISFLESDTESNASDVMIVDYEKPWNDRSPIRLSSAEESDCDLMITGMTYVTDPVKKERKKKSQDEETEKAEKRKKTDGEEASTSDRHHKKKRRKTSSSRSRSDLFTQSPEPDQGDINMNPYKQRSRSPSGSQSRSPMRGEFENYSSYLHKKYHYLHPDSSISKKPGYKSGMFRQMTGSSTDTDSDNESHISIRSRKEKSKSGHSSIEIVKYKKKSSKYKHTKKHSKSRSSDRERHADNPITLKQKKRKDKKEQKHKKSKKKSKSKKDKGHSKDDLEKLMRKYDVRSDSSDRDCNGKSKVTSEEEISFMTDREKSKCGKDKRKKEHPVGTSDSDIDSDTEDGQTDTYNNPDYQTEGTCTDKTVENTQKDGLNSLELVELSEWESVAFDKELERITRGLPIIPPPPQQQVINTAQIPSKSFKKHPHGHKKSSKNTQAVLEQLSLAQPSIGSSDKMFDNYTKDESNIQSSDITSCTDIDSRINLLIKSQERLDAISSFSSCETSADYHGTNTTSTSQHVPGRIHESPTSSGYRNTDIVDVETLSEGSDVDVTHVEVAPHGEKAIDVEGLSDSEPEIDIHSNEVHDNEIEGEGECKDKHIDVVGSSCEDSDNENVMITGSSWNETSENTHCIGELFHPSNTLLSDSDSDTTVNFNEDEERENIDIIGDSDDSDSDGSHHLEIIDSESDGGEIDVIHANDDVEKDEDQINLPSCSSNIIYDSEIPIDFQFNSKDKSPERNDKFSSDTEEPTKVENSVACKQDEQDASSDDNEIHDETDETKGSCSPIGNTDGLSSENEPIENNDKNDAISKSECEEENTKVDNCDSDHTNNDEHSSLVPKVVETDSCIEQEDIDEVKKVLESNENSDKPEESTSSNTSNNAEETDTSENQSEGTGAPQLSLNWILNQNFESSSTLSTIVNDRRPSSPPYMSTVYDRDTTELPLSPDLPFESISQNSPRQLSPASSQSETETDSFIHED